MFQVSQNQQQPFGLGAQPNQQQPQRRAVGAAQPGFGSGYQPSGVDGVWSLGGQDFQPRYDRYTMDQEPGAQPRGDGPQTGWDRTVRSEGGGRTITELGMDGAQTGTRADERNTLPGDLLKFGAMAAGIHGLGTLATGAAGSAGASTAVGPGMSATTGGYGSIGTGLGAGGTGAGLSTTAGMSSAVTPTAAGLASAGGAAASGGGVMDTVRQAVSGLGGLDTLGKVATGVAGVAAANRGSQPVGVEGDFTAAADQQGAENFRTNEYNLNRNRFDTNTPIGGTSWTRVPDPNAPGGFREVLNTNMSPEERAIYDTRASNQGQAGAMASGLAGSMREQFTAPFSLDGIQGTERVGGFQGPVAAPQGPAAQQMGGGTQLGRVQAPNGGAAAPEMAQDAGPLARQDMSGAQSPEFQRAQREGLPAARDLYGETGYEDSRANVEQAMQQRISRMMEPQLQRAETALDTQLRNQGLMPGTEGYDNAMSDLRQSQANQRADAIDRAVIAGGQEQSRLAGLDLAADDQRFGQQRSIYQDMFGELGYNNDLTDRESSTSWDRSLQGNQFNRQSQQGDFDNLLSALTNRNTTRRAAGNDQFGQTLDAANFNNSAALDEFGMGLSANNFNAGERDRAFSRDMDSFRTGYDTAFGLGSEQRANSGFNNTVRQQDVADRLLPRNQSLDEFTRLAGFGREAQMPTAPNTGMSNLQSSNYLGAAEANYGRNTDNRNARTSRDQQLINLFSELFGFGG